MGIGEGEGPIDWTVAGDLLKSELFRRLGFGGDAAVYEQVLEEAGLSRAAKGRISVGKQEQVRGLLESRFIRVCGRSECRKLGAARAEGRALAPAEEQADCQICGGSVNALAVGEMVTACRAVGWGRLCVVGGSPSTAAELQSLVAGRLEMRMVEGTLARTRREAERDLAWADRVVIWGSTELAHKVSTLYKGAHVITSPRRGVAELARAVAESAARAGAKR
jgi:hypothetical protein